MNKGRPFLSLSKSLIYSAKILWNHKEQVLALGLKDLGRDYRILLKLAVIGLLATVPSSLPSIQRIVPSKPRVVAEEEIPLILAAETYDLEGIRQGQQAVPRFQFNHLPRKHGEKLGTDRRKALFLKTMLPMILHVNEKIQADRHRLRELYHRSHHGRRLRPRERAWVQHLAHSYRMSSENLNMKKLLERVDMIPPSLALAQSVVESGWGMNSLAAKRNSPFGHRVAITESTPEGGKRKKLKLKSFESLGAAIEAYIHNINTHPAYEQLRALRLSKRMKGELVTGLELARGLTRYSELGDVYVKKVVKIIEQNSLTEFDSAFLDYE